MLVKMLVARIFKTLHQPTPTNRIWPLTCDFYESGRPLFYDFRKFGGTTEIMKEIIGRSLGV
jgi:hypothetical protein